MKYKGHTIGERYTSRFPEDLEKQLIDEAENAKMSRHGYRRHKLEQSNEFTPEKHG